MTETSLDPVLRIERTFSAPRERVYAAWTEGALLGRWSCPEGLTIREAWNEPRVGGRFLVEMIEPDGVTRYVAVGRYLELVPPERIVMTHGWLEDGEAPEAVDARATRVTVELFDEGPRTRMVFVQRGFPSVETRDGHDEGWRSAFRLLDALLAEAGEEAGAGTGEGRGEADR
jgi:uncharacterized protein YndB with AHSA1/START domain